MAQIQATETAGKVSGNGNGATTGGTSHETATIVKPTLTYQQRIDGLKVTPVPWESEGVRLRGALVGILDRALTVRDGMAGAATAEIGADIGGIFDAVEGVVGKWRKLTSRPDPLVRGALCRAKASEAAAANLPTAVQCAGIMVVLSRDGMNATVASLGSVGAVHAVSVTYLDRYRPKATPEMSEQVSRLLATHPTK